MNVLIVYGTKFGTTGHFANVMAKALRDRHAVRVVDVADARELTGDEVDLLLVGAPTQIHGLRLLVRPFLTTLPRRAFVGVAAAAFDTRMEGSHTGSAADGIAKRLQRAGCRIVAPPLGLIVKEYTGGPASGEEDRAAKWALAAAEAVAVAA